MIVITNPTPIVNEVQVIRSLFDNGLKVLHIRKPTYSEAEMKAFLLTIKPEYKHQLVLHTHHQLAATFGISRIHFTEKTRLETAKNSWKALQKRGFILSTSVHQMNDFESLNNAFAYAFFGPVFESISKPNYVSHLDFKKELERRNNNYTALVAVGGIQPHNIKTAMAYGFDSVALLGSIWHSNSAIKNFKLCQQIVLSY